MAIMCSLPAQAQTPDEMAFAKRVLMKLQDNSFAANREYCGTIGMTQDFNLVAALPRKGRRSSCAPRDPRNAVEIIASFHTHGGWDEDSDSEVPSSDDVRADMAEGIDGYVSTPGGRLWFIDGQAGVSRQLCGVGCLPMDPRFQPEYFGPVQTRYTLEQLLRREAE